MLLSQDNSVTRAAGSLGVFDIVAMNEYGVRLIQVKSTRAKKPKSYGADIKAIKAFTKHPPNTSKELWMYAAGEWEIKVL